MKKVYIVPLFILILFSSFQSFGQTTYVWNGSVSNDWTVAANWSLPRVTPLPNDILLFNNGLTNTIINVPTQSIGRLSVFGNTIVNLQAAATATVLTITGEIGQDDLSTTAGSELNVTGANTLTITLTTGTTGSINGNMSFSNAAHKLDAADASAINFNSPAIFSQNIGCAGNVFTNTGTANAIQFNAGTSFVQNAGADPFGYAAPISKVSFNTGNLFKIQQNALPSFSGRTYANLEIDAAGFAQSVVGAGLLTIDNLTITTGTLNINLTTAGVNIKGNISVAAGQTLNFNPVPASTLILNGTTTQNITNAGTLSFGNDESLSIDNAAGVVLNNNITLGNNGILTLLNGKILLSNTTLFTISNPAPAAIVGADLTKYIIDTGTTSGLKRAVAAATNAYSFPIGTTTNYKPAIINFTTAPTIAGSLTARFKNSYPGWNNIPNTFNDGPLLVNVVSFQGSWFMDAADGLTGGVYTGTFTGNGAGDVNNYLNLVLVKRPSSGGNWGVDGAHVTTIGSNTQPVVSRTGMSGFSEFAIGGEIGIALPIDLNYLNGFKQNSSHLLNWKVTCNNNAAATMVLERSADKQNFTTITTVTATALRCQQPFDYSDKLPLAGINYYRLKMIDANGKVTYSSVIALLNKATGFEIVNLLPTVVNSNAILNVTAAQKTKMDIVITDITGRQVQKISYNLTAGSNQFNLNLSNLAAGTYQITGYTADEKSKTIRFVKQ